MTAPAWLQAIAGVFFGTPVLVIVAIALLLAIGGIIGLSESVFARFRGTKPVA